MRLQFWIAGSLTLLPLSAQSTTALAVRNLVLQQDDSYIEFEVANQAAKPAHSWTMALTARRNGTPAQVEFLLTSESCLKEAAGPLAPAQARKCSASLRSANAGVILEVIPRVTAVLFEDGSAEGDLAALDRQTAERAARVAARKYWLDRYGEALGRGEAVDQLRQFAELLRASAANVPEDLAKDPSFVREQRWLEQQVSNALRQTEMHNLDAGTTMRGLGAEMERRLKVAKEAAALFPARKT